MMMTRRHFRSLRGYLAQAALLVACLAGLAAPRAVLAAELDAQRQAVLQSMYQEDAVLTEKIHRDFWAGFDSGVGQPDTQASMARLAVVLKNSLEFERAQVLSQKASIRQRKPVVDPGYDQALQSRLEMLRARKLPPDNVLAKDKAFRESLVPISQGKAIEAPNGSKILMNDFILDKVLRNIEATHARLERLLNPVWTAPAIN